MSDFSEIVYRDGGRFQRPGGTYSTLGVKSQTELDAALSAGWFRTMPEAIAGVAVNHVAPVDEKSPPTRAELEQMASELGIKFDGRTSDRKLSALIDEKLGT